ncbi:hypothetical protein [Bacillus sp. CGMCC 1.16541]|uniref:hypothetical protein n=1 Tax=Bacillus sp. CGMCC 1.16541 TaxID=2185143 RepID=UPI000D73A7C8|nr:hypothetical protein [Bacillus sp. CGMCC 1.16541]
MFKKILNILIVTSLLLVLGVGNAFAAENSGTTEINKEEYKAMMEAVKDKVKQGKEDEVENLPEVIDFKEKYTENEINEFVKTTDAFKSAFDQEIASNEIKSEDLEIGMNEEKIVEFEDGSFVVISDTTEEELKPVKDGMISTMATHTGTAGKNYKTDYKQQWWGVYLAMEAHLITRYTVYKDKITIYDTDHAGTKAIFPTTVDAITTSVVSNNKKSVQSKGNYRKTNGVVIGSQPIGYVTYHTLRTTISISSVSGSTVKFTTKSTTE